MDKIFQQKKQLRAQILRKRAALAEDWIIQNSRRIHNRLESLKMLENAEIIHSYVAWQNEVETRDLIADLLATGKRVVVPVVEKITRRLKHAEIKSLDELKPGAFGIMEPQLNIQAEMELKTIGIIIVPGLAFDLYGHRLGYGGGYYDAFLQQVSALKIALGFEFQIVEKIPTRNEDERIDILVTENQVYDFRK